MARIELTADSASKGKNMQNEIPFPRTLVNQLLHQAQISPQAEVCGLIGARHGIPVSVYPVNNVAKCPESQFLLDPAEQIDAFREIRFKDEELFAIYHSHPNAPAKPSRTDLDQAGYPEALQLIISLNTKGVLEMRAFRYDTRGEAREVVIELI